MDKLQAPRGLIRYASENEAKSLSPRGLLARPRVRIYGGLLLGLCLAMAWGLSQRPDLRLDVIRDRGVLARQVEDGAVENIYRLQIVNLAEAPRQMQLSVQGLAGAQIVDGAVKEFRAGEARSLVIKVRLPLDAVQALSQGSSSRAASQPLRFKLSNDQGDALSEPSTFLLAL